ncbi:hypothetical protein BC828DRAFT_402899 [Blastocladiella britannica]|nr:hypothetical protein BC828DRAFT_402899 [Blastocladiella britannica]
MLSTLASARSWPLFIGLIVAYLVVSPLLTLHASSSLAPLSADDAHYILPTRTVLRSPSDAAAAITSSVHGTATPSAVVRQAVLTALLASPLMAGAGAVATSSLLRTPPTGLAAGPMHALPLIPIAAGLLDMAQNLLFAAAASAVAGGGDALHHVPYTGAIAAINFAAYAAAWASLLTVVVSAAVFSTAIGRDGRQGQLLKPIGRSKAE